MQLSTHWLFLLLLYPLQRVHAQCTAGLFDSGTGACVSCWPGTCLSSSRLFL